MTASLLASISLGVAVLVAVVSYVVPVWLDPHPRPERRPSVGSAAALGAVAIVVFFLLTLPKSAPFSPGQRLGLGFLIGGVLGLVALLGCARLARDEEGYWPYSIVFALSLAVAAASLTLLLFGGYVSDALIGCSLGFGVSAGVALVVPVAAAEVRGALEAAAVLGVTVAAGGALARQHFITAGSHGWWPYVLALAALAVLGYAIAYSFSLRPRTAGGSMVPMAGSGLLAGVLVLGVGALLAARLAPPSPMIGLLLLGLATGGLVAWLLDPANAEPVQPESRARAAALASLLVLFLVVVGFKVGQGFGAAVALAAAWALAPLPLVLFRRDAWSPARVLALGANYLLLRLALEGGLGFSRDLDMSHQYALIGLVLGALLPVLLASLSDRPGVGRTLLLGALAVLSPVLVLALWGTDAGLGLLAGLVAAPAVAALLAPFAPAAWIAPAALVSVAMALVTAQAGHSASALYELPRAYKAYLAGAVALVAVIWVLGVGLARARAARAPAPAGER